MVTIMIEEFPVLYLSRRFPVPSFIFLHKFIQIHIVLRSDQVIVDLFALTQVLLSHVFRFAYIDRRCFDMSKANAA